MVLTDEEHLDGEGSGASATMQRHQLVEDLERRTASGGASQRADLAGRVDAHDPPLCGERMHDAKPMLVQQRVELSAKGAEAARLHLDELAVSTNEIDHEPAQRNLEPITRPRKDRLDRCVQRTFTDHADPGPPPQAKAASGEHDGDRPALGGRIG
jgi:hypothetical protein